VSPGNFLLQSLHPRTSDHPCGLRTIDVTVPFISLTLRATWTTHPQTDSTLTPSFPSTANGDLPPKIRPRRSPHLPLTGPASKVPSVLMRWGPTPLQPPGQPSCFLPLTPSDLFVSTLIRRPNLTDRNVRLPPPSLIAALAWSARVPPPLCPALNSPPFYNFWNALYSSSPLTAKPTSSTLRFPLLVPFLPS